jgi:hypothetical protein
MAKHTSKPIWSPDDNMLDCLKGKYGVNQNQEEEERRKEKERRVGSES